MAGTLLLDIGAGTLDVAWLDETGEQLFQAVCPSPVRVVAGLVEKIAGPTVISGREMGGGALAAALAEKAKQQRLVITPAAAATISHQLEKVESLGLELAVEEKALGLAAEPGWGHLILGDVRLAQLQPLMELLGARQPIDIVGICLQDHGRPPAAESHLSFRSRWLTKLISEANQWRELGFFSTEIPTWLGRMRSAAADAAELLPGKIFIMDSSLAAVCGAAAQAIAEGCHSVLAIDAATSHTMAALFEEKRIVGYFELHTRDATSALIDEFIDGLLSASLHPQDVLDKGGHGGWCSGDKISPQVFLAVGPRRKLLLDSRYSFRAGAPLGNNYLAGCAGLAAALGLATPFSRF